MKPLFSAVLFLSGTILCSVPAKALELRSDMACTDARFTRPAEHLQLIAERNERERHYAQRANSYAMGRDAVKATEPVKDTTPLSPSQQAELLQAAERYVRRNASSSVFPKP